MGASTQHRFTLKREGFKTCTPEAENAGKGRMRERMGCNAPTPGDPGVMSELHTAHPSWAYAKSSPKRPREGSWGWLCLGWRKELTTHVRLWRRQAHRLAKEQLLPWQQAAPLGKVPFRLVQVRGHLPTALTTADQQTTSRKISQHPYGTSNGHEAERSISPEPASGKTGNERNAGQQP